MKLVFLCIALAGCWHHTQADPVCTATVDVGFVLDSSGSIRQSYQKEKDFVKNLALAFGIQKGQAHAGVVTFSDSAVLSIPFNKYYTTAAFNKAVDGIRHMNGFTRIDLAFKVAKDKLFNPQFGARTKVPKLLIFITDGKHSDHYICRWKIQNYCRRYRINRKIVRRCSKVKRASRPLCRSPAEGPIPYAKAAAKAGIKIIVIGVGKEGTEISKKELRKYSKDVYTASDFKVLLNQKFIDTITDKMCTAGIHECDTKNKGGCSQLCHKSGKQWKCDCEVGYLLDKDGKSCFRDHMAKCRHGQALVKLGCFLQLVAPLCTQTEIANFRSMFQGKWSPPAVAKKVAEEIVCKCSGLAHKRKHSYFSIRNTGECLTGNPDQPTRMKLSYFDKLLHSSPGKCFTADGKFQPCEEKEPNMCIGGPEHDYVYLMQDHCSVNNGGCSHHCEDVAFAGVECKCRYGFKLLKDEKTCKRNNYTGAPVIIG